MAENTVIEAELREGTGKGAARSARRSGFVPGVIYGGGGEPQPINIKFPALLKRLKAGGFLSHLIEIRVGGELNRVVCRGVQRDVVRDIPIHVDFLRLTERSRVNLAIPVEFINHDLAPGLRRGGTVTVVRPTVDLRVTAGNIPENLVVDLDGLDIGDVVKISNIALPQGARPVIADRDFVIANIAAPSSLRSEDEDEESQTGEEEIEGEGEDEGEAEES